MILRLVVAGLCMAIALGPHQSAAQTPVPTPTPPPFVHPPCWGCVIETATPTPYIPLVEQTFPPPITSTSTPTPTLLLTATPRIWWVYVPMFIRD